MRRCLLNDSAVSRLVSRPIGGILSVQDAIVRVLRVVHVLRDDVGPGIREEELPDMGRPRGHSRILVDGDIDVVSAAGGKAGEDRLKLCDAVGRGSECAAEERRPVRSDSIS